MAKASNYKLQDEGGPRTIPGNIDLSDQVTTGKHKAAFLLNEDDCLLGWCHLWPLINGNP